MEKFIPKSTLDWIWTGGMVTLIGLVIYTLAAGESPFETLGFDPKTTTIVVGLLMLAGLAGPYIFRRRS